ncbi:MAG: glycine cleavage system aminomethyltransferase GcvT [Gammaproteobacteria bacterium]
MSESQALAQTPLHALHLELGGKMVPFAGYAMPVQYPAGILKEHNHTRAAAGLFDVSHMGQLRLHGAAAAAALEQLVPVDLLGLKAGRQRYALFTNAQGGILDDLMVTNAGDHLFVVVNAACKAQDTAHLRQHLSTECEIEELNDRALLALQGPQAGAVLARLAPASQTMVFMSAQTLQIAGSECFVTRSGYTGEDGFEISVPAADAEQVARTLLAQPEVQPIGLGARDSLRLEAGLCLYGHDIDTGTTPVEANLNWAIQKVRRTGGARAGGFPGADIILQQLAEGTARKRVGLLPQGRAPVREGAQLTTNDGRVIGHVTSGGFGPSVGGPIAMGYVESAFAAPDTEIQALVRGKPLAARVTRLPFVEQRYYRG